MQGGRLTVQQPAYDMYEHRVKEKKTINRVNENYPAVSYIIRPIRLVSMYHTWSNTIGTAWRRVEWFKKGVTAQKVGYQPTENCILMVFLWDRLGGRLQKRTNRLDNIHNNCLPL